MSEIHADVEVQARQQLMAGMGQVGLRLSKIDAQMREILAAAKRPEAKLLHIRNVAMQLLLDNDLAVEHERVHCMHAGIHNRNRYGDGITPTKVHNLMKGILGNSFQESMLDWPCCIEMPPHANPRRDVLRRFNLAQVHGSAGRLPEYTSAGDAIRVLTLTCGHTTQTLRCLWHGAPSELPGMTRDGCLDKELLRKADPKYFEAVQHGIEYRVIKWQVEEAFPDLLDLLQEAGNATNWLCEGESRLQLMLKMHSHARESFQQLSGEVTDAEMDALWKRVIEAAKRGNPPYLVELEDLLYATRHLSGGLSRPRFLELVSDFCRTLESERIVRGDIWKSLAALAVGGKIGSVPKFRISCIMACAGASSAFSCGPEQTLMSTSDVSSLAAEKNFEHVFAAEEMITDAEALMLENGAYSNHKARAAFFLLRLRLVHHVLKKKDASRGVFPTANSIGAQFAADIAAIVQRPVASKWGAPSPDVGTQSSKSAAASKTVIGAQMTSFDAMGDVENFAAMLEAAGYSQGDTIRRKSDDRVFTLVCAGALCTIADAAGVETSIRAEALLKKNFVKEIVEKIEYMQDWAQADGTKSFEWRFAKIVGSVIHAVDELHAEHPCRDGLEIVTKPSHQKGVYASMAFARGALVMVPVSTNILAKKNVANEAPKMMDADLGLTLLDNKGNTRNVVQPHPSEVSWPLRGFHVGGEWPLIAPSRALLSAKVVITKKDISPKEIKPGPKSSSEAGQHLTEEQLPWVHPYWRVDRTSGEGCEDTANMVVQRKSAGGMLIPCLVNQKNIEEGERLVCYIEKKKPAATVASAPTGQKTKSNAKKEKDAAGAKQKQGRRDVHL